MSLEVGNNSVSVTVADLNLALQKLIEGKVRILDADGTTFYVPVFFRARDSKVVADVIPLASIHISYVGAERAEAVYKQGCSLVEVLAEDADGNPTKYSVKPFPEPMEMSYTIEVRAQHWDDLSTLQEQLDRLFPPTHRSLKVKDNNLNLFRREYIQADNDELALFIRQWNIGIIAYLDISDCDDSGEAVFAVREIDATIQADPDPEIDPDPLITEEIIICPEE